MASMTTFEWLTVAGVCLAVGVPGYWHLLSRIQKLETKQESHSEADNARFGELREKLEKLDTDHEVAKHYWDTRFDGITSTLTELTGKVSEVLGYLKAKRET